MKSYYEKRFEEQMKNPEFRRHYREASAEITAFDKRRNEEIDAAMEYVLLTPDEDGGFVAECTAVPGCISQGDTEEEARENIRDAISVNLANTDRVHRDIISLLADVTFEQEEDGRWIAEMEEISGCMAYGENRTQAALEVMALYCRIVNAQDDAADLVSAQSRSQEIESGRVKTLSREDVLKKLGIE